VSTKAIRPSVQHTTCDVCGRTLLRGENPDAYVAGGELRWVCDLCTTRALHEGWVREGTVPQYDRDPSARDRRRTPLGWLRTRRGELYRPDRSQHTVTGGRAHAGTDPAIPPPVAPVREPRHVRAIPTNVEHKVSSAIEVFNRSEHARTIAGVARSLGSPSVAVRQSSTSASVINVVASWELCWYRYEIDLADERPGVRVSAQGSELTELEGDECDPNATADADGLLALKE
jgi:hypothetical protein